MDIWRYLDDIESRIDEAEEQALFDAWVDFSSGKNSGGPFVPPLRTPRPSSLDWHDIHINDTLEDENLMILSQLSRINRLLSSTSNRLMCIRANYGVGNLPSLFGAERFTMPRKMNELPNVRAIPGGLDGILRLIEAPLPSPLAGNGKAIDSVGRMYARIRQTYPKFRRFVMIDHPDAQGPMDVCELLWGSDLFYALYDEPDAVHALLRKVTDAYKMFIDHWLSIVPIDYNCYFGELALGRVMLRDDSAMNLSPAMFGEYIVPYDSELLAYYSGGMHFCGRGDHFIDQLARIPHLTAVNLSQPHLNDMEKIFKNTIDRGISLRIAPGDYSLKGHNVSCLYIW